MRTADHAPAARYKLAPMTTSGIDDLARDLQLQRDFLVAREPAYARLLELLDDAVRGELGAGLARAWAGRDFNSYYERPLLLLAAMRYDALCEGSSHPLHAATARTPATAETATADSLAAAVAPARTRFWHAVRDRAVQTNETTRAVTWLWPAHLLARAGEQRALALVDLGTSAGLNLIADALPPLWHDQDGTAIPVAPRPAVSLRLGLDLAPLDVRDDDTATWLRACVWPSDGARLARLEQGIACFRASAASEHAPRLEVCALTDAPARLDELSAEPLLLCMQSVVRDYLSRADRERHDRGMRELLLRRPPRSTLWCELEVRSPPGTVAPEGAATVTVRFVDTSGVLRELVLARTHPHPARLACDAAAVAALVAAFAAPA